MQRSEIHKEFGEYHMALYRVSSITLNTSGNIPQSHFVAGPNEHMS